MVTHSPLICTINHTCTRRYSLEDLFNKCGRRFSLRTVLQLADQVLERVETMHNRHLIHRDIKPANFVIGHGGNAHVVHCIDFGLSKRYRHPRTLQHIAYRDGRSLTGTPRYASINNHLGIGALYRVSIDWGCDEVPGGKCGCAASPPTCNHPLTPRHPPTEQSRRDDLESIGYVLVYFLRGVLPWQGLKAKTASKKYKMIMEKKQSVSITELCQGCPIQFAEYLTYCRSLSFDGKPDMQYLRGLFRDLFLQQGYGPSPPPASATSATGSGGGAASARLVEWDWDRFLAPSSSGSRGASGGGGGGGGGAAGGEEEKARERERRERERSERHAAMEVVDLTGSDPPTPQPHPAAAPTQPLPTSSRGAGAVPHRAPEPPVAMMQMAQTGSDLAGEAAGSGALGTHGGTHGPTSPLNKLKSSLRISDDDGGGGGGGGGAGGGGGGGPGGKSHKRHLSLSQGGEGAGDGPAGWGGADYKQQLGGSRPKTAHPHPSHPGSGTAASASPAANNAAAASSPGVYSSSACRRCGTHGHACSCGGLKGEGTAAAAAAPAYHSAASPASGAAPSSSTGATPGKQGTFLDGFLRKAKSFARPTSSSNLGAPGTSSSAGGGGSGAAVAGASGAASARRPAMTASSSSSKVSAGGCGGVDVICA